MSPNVKEILGHVETWPEEDQQELAEVAREIEARRTGAYHASPEELRALDEAEKSGIASDDEVAAAFRSFQGRGHDQDRSCQAHGAAPVDRAVMQGP